MRWGIALIGGGLGAAALALLTARKASAAEARMLPGETDSGGRRPTFDARLTTYYPLAAATDAAKKLEGPPVDRKSKALHYLEEAATAPYVSVSGDPAAFPYGQLIYLDAFPGVKFRVVDDGQNFMGSTKVYRDAGHEPLDIAVRFPSTKVPTYVVATIVKGDTLDKPDKFVDASRFRGQTVLVGLDILGALAADDLPFTAADRDALGRLIEAVAGTASAAEQQAVAWATRNRARARGASIAALLAPGSSDDLAGALGDATPSPQVLVVADIVLAQPREADPTGGATDFWSPEEHRQCKILGDLYRQAAAGQDMIGAADLAAFSDYALTVGDVRALVEERGLHVLGFIGTFELLG